MATTITKETTRTVHTIIEARDLVEAAFDEYGENLKSLSVFVWSEKTAGIEVKVSAILNTEHEPL